LKQVFFCGKLPVTLPRFSIAKRAVISRFFGTYVTSEAIGVKPAGVGTVEVGVSVTKTVEKAVFVIVVDSDAVLVVVSRRHQEMQR